MTVTAGPPKSATVTKTITAGPLTKRLVRRRVTRSVLGRLFPVRLRGRYEPMPDKFYPLATYNAECYRGIVHTAEYDAKMAELQREFDAWQQASW